MRNSLLFAALAALSACSSSSDSASPDAESSNARNIVQKPNSSEDVLLDSALKAYDRQLYSVSLTSFNELREGYPASYFTTLAELKSADAQFFANDYPSAIASYENFLKIHPGHEAAAYVRFQIGNSYREQYRGPEHDQNPVITAMKSYEQVIAQYPGSEYAPLAKKKLDECKELLAEHEAVVARFYERRGNQTASAKRAENLTKKYAQSQAAQQLKAEQEDEAQRQRELAEAEAAAQREALGDAQQESAPEQSAEVQFEQVSADVSSAADENSEETKMQPETELEETAEAEAREESEESADEVVGNPAETEAAPASPKLVAAAIPQEPGLLWRTVCAPHGTVTLFLRNGVEFKLREQVSANTFRYHFAGDRNQSIQRKQLCSISGIEVRAEEANGDIRVELRSPKPLHVSLGRLTRPDRVIFTLKK